MKPYLSTAIFSLMLFFTNNSYALKCNHRIIDIGDYQFDVLRHCGEPDYTDTYYKYEGTRLRSPDRSLIITENEAIVIEEWTYNFGSNKLMRLLIFENNVLKKIRTLGYGYR